MLYEAISAESNFVCPFHTPIFSTPTTEPFTRLADCYGHFFIAMMNGMDFQLSICVANNAYTNRFGGEDKPPILPFHPRLPSAVDVEHWGKAE
jgi:hypothetical protein